MSDVAIRTQGLSRDFGSIRALDGLDMEVLGGIVFGFLGPNGSGKTTTIRLLLGLLEPTGGRAEVFGLDTRTRSESIRAQSGALLEHSGLYDRLSAEDNLEFYGRIWRLPASERKARTRELLEHVGLWDRRGEVVGGWSRGMKQKLAVARALLHRPSLIFLDEPTAGLDPVAAAALREDLAALAAREGVTVFLTTHNLAEAERLCARLAVISHGKLLAIGTPEELKLRTGGSSAEIVGHGFDEALLAALRARLEVTEATLSDGRLSLGLQGDAPLAPLVALVVGAGGQVEEVRRHRASLEEAFLALLEEDR